IRDDLVTGVQTCALPIYSLATPPQVAIRTVALALVAVPERCFCLARDRGGAASIQPRSGVRSHADSNRCGMAPSPATLVGYRRQIGRASCRGRGWWSVGG